MLKKSLNISSPKVLRICLAFVFIIISVIIHHNILLLQNHYCIEIGPGDKGHFINDKRSEFGIRHQREWFRLMKNRSSIHLPLTLRGQAIKLGFEIKSISRPEKVVLTNKNNEIIGMLKVRNVGKSAVYEVLIPVSSLPDKKMDILLSSGKGDGRRLDLEINRVYINTISGGTSQPWKNDLPYVLIIVAFWALLWLAGFDFSQGSVGTAAFSLLAIFGRFLDPLAYMKYTRIFLFPGIPILILSILFIRFILSRFSVFRDESIRILSALFIIGFIIYFIGIFYPYHLNSDGQLRISFFRLMAREGVGEFINEMSRQHSVATGIENQGVPYPPWFNILALPSVKLGIYDFLWLRFQFLITNSFYILLMYGLARQMGFSKNTSRISSFFSIFGNGVLHDISIFSYDPRFAFTLALLFIIAYFKNAEKLVDLELKKKIQLMMILGLILITHPDVLIFFGLFFVLTLAPVFFSRIKEKWKTTMIHMEIGMAGFFLSLLLFYGFFFRDLLLITIPNAVNNPIMLGTGELESPGNGIGEMLVKTISRIINMIPILFIPFLIYGFWLMFKIFKKKKMNWTGIFIISWILVYVVLLFLRTTGIFFNYIKYLPEYELIYPIIFIALGYSFSELYYKYKQKLLIKSFLISIVFLGFLFNLLWFYCYKIGMTSKIEDFLRPLAMFF